MKKFRIIPVMMAIVLCLMAFALAGCKKSSIATPTDFALDDEYNLTWSPVSNARSYSLSYTKVSDGSSKQINNIRKATYDLSGLEEGDYEIYVKAVSGNSDYGDSAWSGVVEFHKDYESGCLYTLTNGRTEYEVTSVSSATGVVDLGDEYRGKPVTSIADLAFKGNGRVTSVTVGKYVTSIGDSAFYNCTKLTSITLPESLTSIGESAFQGARMLASITIPSNVTRIEYNTFAYCRSLTSVNLGNVQTICENAFYGCSALTSLTIPDSVTYIGTQAFSNAIALVSVEFGSGLETIDTEAFRGNEALTTLTFAEDGSLEEIGESAFYGCTALTSVTLPEGLTSLDQKAFYLCTNLGTVDLPESLEHVGSGCFTGTAIYNAVEDGFVYVDDWLVTWRSSTKSSVQALVCAASQASGTYSTYKVFDRTDIVGIADSTFSGLTSLEAVVIPTSVKYLGKYAFAYDTSLTRFLSITSTTNTKGDLVYIDSYAFMNCTELSTLRLNEGLERIGNYAFYSCTSLKNTSTSIIPSTVTHIGTGAFKKSKLYTDQSGVVYAGYWVVGFNGDNVTSASIDGYEVGTSHLAVYGISDYAFSGITALQTVEINSNDLKYIGEGVFYNCSALTGITLGSGITEIDDYMFYGCESLLKVNLSRTIESIGRAAFYKCAALTSIDMSKTNVTSVGMYAFYGCTNLGAISFNSVLEDIGDYAFYKCTALRELSIPDSVTDIGYCTFYKCENLTSVTLGSGISEIDEYVFSGCTSLTSVVIPSNVKTVGSYAFYNCSKLETVTLSEGVETIGKYAFGKATALKTVKFPSTLTTIEKYAFMRCESLTDVVLPSTLTTLGDHAFFGCTSATFYVEAATRPEGWSSKWNSSYRTVLFGCVFGDDGYVASVTLADGSFIYPDATNGIADPTREGYTFLGWATEEGATEAEYSMADLKNVASGTTLYTVWSTAA